MNNKNLFVIVILIIAILTVVTVLYFTKIEEDSQYGNDANLLSERLSLLQKEKQEGDKKRQELDSQLQNCSKQNKIIAYYYNEDCPYCEKVNQFIIDNKIEEKIAFTKKETLNSRENSYEQQDRYNECTHTNESAGVPFLYVKGFNSPAQCFMGYVEVENFFKKEAGIKNN